MDLESFEGEMEVRLIFKFSKLRDQKMLFYMFTLPQMFLLKIEKESERERAREKS